MQKLSCTSEKTYNTFSEDKLLVSYIKASFFFFFFTENISSCVLLTEKNLTFFFTRKQTYTFIYFSVSLNLWGVQHHMDSVANGFSRKGALEFGRNPTTISMSMSYFSPDYSGFVRFVSRSHCVILCFLHIRTYLAYIKFSFISSISTFNFQRSCVSLLFQRPCL